MTRTEQTDLVVSLCDAMRDTITRQIREGDVPEEWDGHELRCLVADRAASNASISSVRKYPRHARALAYKNTILTTNLL